MRAAFVLGVLLAVVAAGVGGGCRSEVRASAAANSPAHGEQTLALDDEGHVSSAAVGIDGRWFASADTEDCQKRGKHAARECSLFIAPDPRAPTFRPTGDLGMCTMGVVAKVLLGSDDRMDWGN